MEKKYIYLFIICISLFIILYFILKNINYYEGVKKNINGKNVRDKRLNSRVRRFKTTPQINKQNYKLKSISNDKKLRAISSDSGITDDFLNNRVKNSNLGKMYFIPERNLFDYNSFNTSLSSLGETFKNEGKFIFKDSLPLNEKENSSNVVDTLSFNNRLLYYTDENRSLNGNINSIYNVKDFVDRIQEYEDSLFIEKIYDVNKTINDILGTKYILDNNIKQVDDLILNYNGKFYGYNYKIVKTESYIGFNSGMIEESYFKETKKDKDGNVVELGIFQELADLVRTTTVGNALKEDVDQNYSYVPSGDVIPRIDNKTHIEPSTLQPYRDFLKKWGSHIVTGIEYGKKINIIETTNDYLPPITPLRSGDIILLSSKNLYLTITPENNLIINNLPILNSDSRFVFSWVINKFGGNKEDYIKDGDIITIKFNSNGFYLDGSNTDIVKNLKINPITDENIIKWKIKKIIGSDNEGDRITINSRFSLEGNNDQLKYYISYQSEDINIISTTNPAEWKYTIYPDNPIPTDKKTALTNKQCMVEQDTNNSDIKWAEKSDCFSTIKPEDKLSANYANTIQNIYINGGTEDEKKIFAETSNITIQSDKLNTLLHSQTNDVIGYTYTSIWKVLMDLFHSRCSQEGKQYTYRVQNIPDTCLGIIGSPSSFITTDPTLDRSKYINLLDNTLEIITPIIKFDTTNRRSLSVAKRFGDYPKYVNIEKSEIINDFLDIKKQVMTTQKEMECEKVVIEGKIPNSFSYENGIDISNFFKKLQLNNDEYYNNYYDPKYQYILIIGNYNDMGSLDTNIICYENGIKSDFFRYHKDTKYNEKNSSLKIDTDGMLILDLFFAIDFEKRYRLTYYNINIKIYETYIQVNKPFNDIIYRISNQRFYFDTPNYYPEITRTSNENGIIYIGDAKVGGFVQSVNIFGNMSLTNNITPESDVLSINIGNYQIGWMYPPQDVGVAPFSFTGGTVNLTDEQKTINEGEPIFLSFLNSKNFVIDKVFVNITMEPIIMANLGDTKLQMPDTIYIANNYFSVTLRVPYKTTADQYKINTPLKINTYMIARYFDKKDYIGIQSYGRGAGKYTDDKCEEYEDKLGTMCYRKCRVGFHSDGYSLCKNDKDVSKTFI